MTQHCNPTFMNASNNMFSSVLIIKLMKPSKYADANSTIYQFNHENVHQKTFIETFSKNFKAESQIYHFNYKLILQK